MKRLLVHIFTAVVFFVVMAAESDAQFYNYGQDPGNVRWMQFKTDNYRIIYPAGLDSIALKIGESLEYYRVPSGEKLGFLPGQNYSKNWPVILHPYTSYSNGLVSLAPRRMELLTTPSAYSTLAMPWIEQLTIHEGRHVAQMQYARQKKYAPFTWLTGELFAGAMAGLYCNPSILEGDAVWAETRFFFSGRGRSDAFLEYYKVAFDDDTRDFWQWRYGSQNKYTPDHYAFGYITTPVFIEEYYSRLRSRFFPFFNLQKSVKAVTGKSVRASFEDVRDSLAVLWKANTAERAPFLPEDTLTQFERLFSEYTGEVAAGGRIYAKKSGLDRTPEVVEIDSSGRQRRICGIPSISSQLAASPTGEIFWSENKSDIRWSLKSSSVIRRMDLDGKVSTLADGRYFNPAVSEDAQYISVSEYPVTGGSNLLILDARTGRVIESRKAPDGLQIVESAWVNGHIIVSGTNNEGFCLYDARDGFRALCKPMATTIRDLRSNLGKLFFSTDLNGVFELYELCPDGSLLQKTSLRHGGSGWSFDGGKLYFSALAKNGRMICSLDTASLLSKPVEYSSPVPMPVPDADSSIHISEAKSYSKAAHLLRFHSWAPLAVHVDNLSAMSFDRIDAVAELGATAFFQNDLNTMSGYVSYAVPHKFEVSATYRGWFPVIEAKFSGGGSNARESFIEQDTLWYRKRSAPDITGSLKLYIPFNLSSSGWSRGLVPQFSAEMNNNIFISSGKKTPINLFCASVRAYSMRNIASSCIYPRWGLGFEAGYYFRIGLSDLYDNYAYGYLYGYLPGLIRTHGIKWTALGYTNNNMLAKFTLDYALPFAPVDWSFLSPLTYIRNFELTLHFDYGKYRQTVKNPDKSTVGADLVARLSNFLWLPFDTRIGVSWRYAFNVSERQKNNFSLVLSIDM